MRPYVKRIIQRKITMNARTLCPMNRGATGPVFALAVALALAGGVAVAQPEVEWERTYDMGKERAELCKSVIQIPNGDFVLAGKSIGLGLYETEDVFCVRTNSAGDSLWSKIIDGGGTDECSQVIHTSAGGFALVGEREVLERSGDVWLYQMEMDGQGGFPALFGTENFDYCAAVVEIADGGFALAGEWDRSNDSTSKGCLIKVNSNGDELWSHIYGGERRNYFNSMVKTEDGGFVLAGTTTSLGDGGENFWLVRVDSLGEELWSKAFGGEQDEYCAEVIQTADGGFALGGLTESFGAGITDFWLVKTNANGDSLWSRTYGGDGEEWCVSLLNTPDGGFALAGMTASFGEHAGDWNGWLVRTDAVGDSIWTSSIGSEFDDDFESIIQLEDGSYVLGGEQTTFWGPGELDWGIDYWLVKTTPDPVSVPEPGVTLEPSSLILSAYPNPFNSMVTIPFSFAAINRGKQSLSIFDPLGRRVADFSPRLPQLIAANRHSLTWNASGMPAGQYIIRLESGNQQLSQRLSLVK